MNYTFFSHVYNNHRIVKNESIKLLLMINAFHVKKFSKHNLRWITVDLLIIGIPNNRLYFILYL